MLYAAIIAVVLSLFTGAILGWLSAVRSAHRTADEAARRASSEAIDQLRSEQAENLRATVETVMSVASSKLGDQFEAGRAVLGREGDQVANKVSNVETELRRVGDLVSSLQKERAEQAGQITTGIRQALAATSALNDTTNSLREALASPKARGQWGERMAEDVLRSAGFMEGVNYQRQKKTSGGGVPDFTFPLPSDRVVHMDVKFPIDNYLRWLDTTEASQKEPLAKAFRIDVRNRVKELTGRGYVDADVTVDYLLLFVPNESVYGFLHEHDPDLIDFALGNKVVLCSPTTLFAVLAVIRQAMDNFVIEKRSHEILGALSGLREQWEKWCEPMDKMRRGLDSAQRAFDELSGPRTRQFERQLERLEGLRDGDGEEPQVVQPEQPALRQVV